MSSGCREREAQAAWRAKQSYYRHMEEQRLLQQKKIRDEWEAEQAKIKEEEERKTAEAEERKKRQAEKLQSLVGTQKGVNGKDASHNPEPPTNDQLKVNAANLCSFYRKVGACRFGDRCSRTHIKPSVSKTLLIANMYSHPSLDSLYTQSDNDISLEYEEEDFYNHFKEFYTDTLPEFEAAGHVIQFKVCCNYEHHLRGNVYVQYTSENEAYNAFKQFNGRWYSGRQLQCSFTSVDKWRPAICGMFHQKKCPKGRSCNFLHVFKNPDHRFYHADRDLLNDRVNRRDSRSKNEGKDSRSERVTSRDGSRSERVSSRKDSRPESVSVRDDSRSERVSDRHDSRSQRVSDRDGSKSERVSSRDGSRSERVGDRHDSRSERVIDRDGSRSERVSDIHDSRFERVSSRDGSRYERVSDRERSSSRDVKSSRYYKNRSRSERNGWSSDEEDAWDHRETSRSRARSSPGHSDGKTGRSSWENSRSSQKENKDESRRHHNRSPSRKKKKPKRHRSHDRTCVRSPDSHSKNKSISHDGLITVDKHTRSEEISNQCKDMDVVGNQSPFGPKINSQLEHRDSTNCHIEEKIHPEEPAIVESWRYCRTPSDCAGSSPEYNADSPIVI